MRPRNTEATVLQKDDLPLPTGPTSSNRKFSRASDGGLMFSISSFRLSSICELKKYSVSCVQ